MSIDTQVVLEAADPQSAIVRLADELTAICPEPLARANAIWRDAWRPNRWCIEDGRLVGPGGWSLTPRQHTVVVYHILRSNTLDPGNEHAAAVIGGVHFFGQFFNSPSAIFSHELLPVPDLPLAESALELSREFAQAKTWEELRGACFEDGCWLMTELPVKTGTALR